ncbi:glycosyltransferase [Pseudoalteromonas shioyasakiensis]|uniref:glycosyltransferase n=1 Tax=Pseudoalteromonas shioyasakiensis TaxID=1190813 RepID=UPI0020965076|nr:glycosyltransferase [Pseudoalteromonas shioyasakiensis]MCO6356679.1 glycosyltransferase [Pseudoalteromonas shioyasakiensis]
MHIAFVLEDFSLGGVERVTEQLIIGLKQYHDCSISIICLDTQGELYDRYQHLGQIHQLAGRFDFSGFRRCISQLSPDLIVFTKGGLSRFSFVAPRNIKTVAVQHVPINLPQEGKLKNVLRRLAATLLYRQVDKIVCVSEGIKENLTEFKVARKQDLIRIYNPVLDPSLINRAKKSVEYSDYYVCVGRLHFQKGYDFLVDIITDVKTRHENIKVVILGDGPDRDSLTTLITEKQLSNNIILHGATDNPYKYIQHAKAILLPSRWEGLPTVLVEAAFLQTPIIAFDCRYGPKELTANGKSGYLANFEDKDKFADYINAFEDDKPEPLASPDVSSFLLEAAADNYYTLFKSIL